MATHIVHEVKNTFYFVTFTCYKWLPLIDKTNLYDYISSWFKQLSKRGCKTCGYVIMPNHIHLLVFVEEESRGLNYLIGNAKRFMAYEIVKRLEEREDVKLLLYLSSAVSQKVRDVGKKHQVFQLSFDAKEIIGEDAIIQVLDYMHHNPANGKWSLVDDFTEYAYSSARFYELGEISDLELVDYKRILDRL